MRESKIERTLRDAVRAAGGECIKINSPGSAGFPDRMILLNGRVLFAELKRPGKGLDALQVYWQSRLRGLGHEAVKVDYLAQIPALIDRLRQEEILS